MLFVPCTDEQGRLKFEKPHEVLDDPNELWETCNVVQLVTALPGRDSMYGGEYILHEDDTKVNGYVGSYSFMLSHSSFGPSSAGDRLGRF